MRQANKNSPYLISRFTERLLQVGAIVVLLWFGWQLITQSVVTIIRAQSRAVVAESALQQCRQGK